MKNLGLFHSLVKFRSNLLKLVASVVSLYYLPQWCPHPEFSCPLAAVTCAGNVGLSGGTEMNK